MRYITTKFKPHHFIQDELNNLSKENKIRVIHVFESVGGVKEYTGQKTYSLLIEMETLNKE